MNLLCLSSSTGSSFVRHAFSLYECSCSPLPLFYQYFCIRHFWSFSLSQNCQQQGNGNYFTTFHSSTKCFKLKNFITCGSQLIATLPTSIHFRFEFPLSNLLRLPGSKLSSADLLILVSIIQSVQSTYLTPEPIILKLDVTMNYCVALRHASTQILQNQGAIKFVQEVPERLVVDNLCEMKVVIKSTLPQSQCG